MQTSAAMISQSTAYDTQKAGANKPAPFPTRSSITRTLAVSLTLLTFLLPIVFTLLLDTLVLSRSSKGTASSPPPEVLRSEGMESVLVWRATERRNGCLWDSQIEATTTTPTLLVVGLSFGDCIGIVLFAILGYLYGKTRKGGAAAGGGGPPPMGMGPPGMGPPPF